MPKKVLGWHFCEYNRKLGYADGRKIIKGRTLSVPGPPELCNHGLHASAYMTNALVYAPSPIVCRVELSGEVVLGKGKMAATKRKTLWWLDISPVLHELACRIAEETLAAAGIKEECCWEAIRLKRLWLVGECPDEQLDAIFNEVFDASWYRVKETDDHTAQLIRREVAVFDVAWGAALKSSWRALRSVLKDVAYAKPNEDHRRKYNQRLVNMVMAYKRKKGK